MKILVFFFMTVVIYSNNLATTNYPPFSYNNNSSYVGILDNVAKEFLGKVKIKSYNYDTLNYKMYSDLNTIFYPIVRTDDNYNDYIFIGPIMKIRYALFALKTNKEYESDKLTDFRTLKIALLRGDVTENYLEENVFKSLLKVKDPKSLVQGLYEEQYKIIAINYESLKYYEDLLGFDNNLIMPLYNLDDISTYLYFCMNKDSDSNLVDEVTKKFEEFKRNKKLNEVLFNYYNKN